MKGITKKFCIESHFIFFFISLFCIVSCTTNKEDSLNVIIDDAYINLPLKGQKMSAGYFKLSNSSNTLKVLNKIICEGVNASFHTSYMNSEGMMVMEPIEDLEIQSHSEVIFQPGSNHVMISGLNGSLSAGTKLECNLIIDTILDLPIIFKLK